MNKIKQIKTRYFKVPLEDVMVDALHGLHTDFEIITTTIMLESGVEGTGYTYTGGWGGVTIATMLKKEFESLLIGMDYAEPGDITDFLSNRFHYVGRGGILSFAISAVDTALWDIKGKQKGKTLSGLLDCTHEKIRTYYGGIDLGYSLEKLLKNIEAQFEAGHTAVKIKLGKENIDEDVKRVAEVRKLIGNEAEFMVDANMIFSPEHAIELSNKILEYDIKWFEEPTNPDDLEGYARIAEQTSIPLAMGENLHLVLEHKHAFDIGKVTYIQPDISNICGITGWLRVAELAKERNLVASSHGMQEIHVNVMAAIDNPGYVEYHSFPIHKYTVDGLSVNDGYLYPSVREGIGVLFDWDKLDQYEV